MIITLFIVEFIFICVACDKFREIDSKHQFQISYKQCYYFCSYKYSTKQKCCFYKSSFPVDFTVSLKKYFEILLTFCYNDVPNIRTPKEAHIFDICHAVSQISKQFSRNSIG